ncbi:hypothetical protein PFICI_08165 [Pestalotiopsis fici W106-1]|uniref:AAA+ ATPase domain-containing protein n=1 Tax=Pestalotiopsis fici (strain W106-1 / CGMCC3.15140) TaxID=1229662 RepID=W3X637_PESFW|nr:uncharacterized protein PFICI_08165 [Pestalotiopsis fici W106-1]ETS80636.1 hypothetical protein PFICI_08165 [Pestalotiopsis fici W106-1]
MIEILAAQSQKLEEARGPASLVLVGDKALRYSEAIKKYHQYLCVAGVLPDTSKFRDFSAKDDCCLKYLKNLPREGGGDQNGTVLINQRSNICSDGRDIIKEIQSSKPELVIILVIRGTKIDSSLQDTVKRFSSILYLPKGSIEPGFGPKEARERVLKLIESRYGGEMQVEGGTDGPILSACIRKISRSCEERASKESIDDAINASLREIYRRQIDRLLEAKSSTEDPSYFLLTAEDMLGAEEQALVERYRTQTKTPVVARQLEGFDKLLDHIGKKLPVILKVLKSRWGELLGDQSRLNLAFIGTDNLDYFEAGSLYHKELRSTGAISNDSQYIYLCAQRHGDSDRLDGSDDSGDDNDASKCVTVTNGVQAGVILVEHAERLCSTCKSSIDSLQEKRSGLVVVLAFHSTSIPSFLKDFVEERFPFQIDLQKKSPDKNNEIQHRVREALVSSIQKQFQGHAQFEGGVNGSSIQACARRISQKCDKDANATDIENAIKPRLTDIYQRKFDRHLEDGDFTVESSPFLFTASDLLGRAPDLTKSNLKEWEELQAMIGLTAVKTSIRSLFDSLLLNYYRELDGHEPVQTGLSRMFLGPPGTGKTTVANLYGKLLASLGFLSCGQILVHNANDFIGEHIGSSVAKTKEILEKARGNVLLIDEAYMLDAKRNYGSSPCPFRQEVVDTLVGEVQNKPGEDLCIIMCGYEEEMRDFLREANPGLARRFPIENAFFFEEFSEEQLGKVLDLKMKEQSFSTSDQGRATALNVLKLAKQRPNFGNGGEVDNLLSRAILSFQRRFSVAHPDQKLEISKNSLLLPEDFDSEHLRGEDIENELEHDFGMIGLGAKLDTFKQLVRNSNAIKKYKKAPQTTPVTLVLKGPPGSGKTAFARKLGRIYYNMGILATQDVVEVTVRDMVGYTPGQTVHATRRLLESSLGKVLFIDGAHRLNGKGVLEDCVSEARDELVDALSKPQFFRKLVVVLAGYTVPMNEMLLSNPGLSGRFSTQIHFEKLSSAACAKLLKKDIQDLHILATFDEDDTKIQGIFRKIRSLDCWANGRSIRTLAGEVAMRSINATYNESLELPEPVASREVVLEVLEEWKRRKVPKIPAKKQKTSDDYLNAETTDLVQ